MRQGIIAFLAVVGLTACGQGEQQASSVKVTNGISSTGAAFPFVAELTTSSGYCSATVIGPNTVLTAAHCVDGASAASMRVKTGEGSFRVAAVRAHPTYQASRASKADLALLKLSGTHASFASLCREHPAARRDILIMGWGNFVYPAPSDTTGTLRYGFNTIDHVGANGIEFTGTARGPGSGVEVGAGTGDSGGPMFQLAVGHGLTPESKFDAGTMLAVATLVGVTSGGYASGNQTFEYYADACANRSWIDSTARSLGARIGEGT